MKGFARILAAFFLLAAGAGGIGYYLLHSSRSEIQPAPANPAPTLRTEAAPAIRYPVPTHSNQPGSSADDVDPKPLPAIDESDQTIETALSGLFGRERFYSLFNLKNIVRRIVVAIDSATAHRPLAAHFWPLNPPEAGFRVSGKGDEQVIAASNFERYLPYVEMIRAVDARKLVDVYVHFYPLFQAAYQDLGAQDYFNDRLVEVIDSILDTPEIKGPIKVLLPSVLGNYKYADETLEAHPAAQKLLVRMGPDSARAMKEKLRQLRTLLIHLKN